MDIEKLKSIIRLANNNPNDNEANLAARKACKILAENDFVIFKQTRTAADKFRSASSSTSNSGIWADVKRSTEPQWKSYEAQKSAEARAYQEEWFRRWDSYWKESEKDPVKGNTSWNTYRYTGADSNFKNKKKKSTTRKCTKCGLEVSTFRIKEEPFVCNVCHWKDV